MGKNCKPMEPLPVVFAFRGDHCENVHFASAVICSKTGNIEQMFPESDSVRAFLRSSAKPFQAYPLYQNPKSIGISLEEWAIICASHAATPKQLLLVQQVLDRAGAGIGDLQCGPHPPIDEHAARELLCSGISPTAIHNNCSGKHAGMLLACRLNDWPLETYLQLDHPLQQAIRNVITTYAETTDVVAALDGCGAPVFCLPMANIAKLFSNLGTQSEFSTMVQAMTTYPDLVGDAQRIDSQLMRITQGNLIAKVGAEGMLGIANRKTGAGLALKIHDGNNAIRDRLGIAILEDVGWITPQQATFLWAQPGLSPQRTNTQGRVVGHFTFRLPWVSPRPIP